MHMRWTQPNIERASSVMFMLIEISDTYIHIYGRTSSYMSMLNSSLLGNEVTFSRSLLNVLVSLCVCARVSVCVYRTSNCSHGPAHKVETTITCAAREREHRM